MRRIGLVLGLCGGLLAACNGSVGAASTWNTVACDAQASSNALGELDPAAAPYAAAFSVISGMLCVPQGQVPVADNAVVALPPAAVVAPANAAPPVVVVRPVVVTAPVNATVTPVTPPQNIKGLTVLPK
jgi:hypothetical protein